MPLAFASRRVVARFLVFLCSTYVDGAIGTQAFGWEPKTGVFEPRGRMPWSRWFPILVPDGQGGLVALTSHEEGDGEASLTFRRSVDAGRTWGSGLDLRDASKDLAALRYSCLMAAGLHSDGTIRVVLAGIEAVAQQAQLCLPRETMRFIWSIDLDPTSGSIIATRPLGAPDTLPSIRSSDKPAVNDDFHSIADGAMAWSHDGVVAWTRLP